MIRYINCFRKKSGVSAEEFREHWNSAEYSELIAKVAAFYHAVRYAMNLTL